MYVCISSICASWYFCIMISHDKIVNAAKYVQLLMFLGMKKYLMYLSID